MDMIETQIDLEENAVACFEMLCDELKSQPDMIRAYILAMEALGKARDVVDALRSI